MYLRPKSAYRYNLDSIFITANVNPKMVGIVSQQNDVPLNHTYK